MPRFANLICSSTAVRKPKILKMKVFSNYFSLYNFSWSQKYKRSPQKQTVHINTTQNGIKVSKNNTLLNY